MRAYGEPSGYIAPISRERCGSLNHGGALRMSSAKSGRPADASVASRLSAGATGTVKFFSPPPACGIAWNDP